jgi:uncharacterized protein (DUF2062 family)
MHRDIIIYLANYTFGSFLMGVLVESFRRNSGITFDLHTALFPYFFFPAQRISVTASIFMTVAIAVERYITVQHSMDYSMVHGHDYNSPSFKL